MDSSQYVDKIRSALKNSMGISSQFLLFKCILFFQNCFFFQFPEPKRKAKPVISKPAPSTPKPALSTPKPAAQSEPSHELLDVIDEILLYVPDDGKFQFYWLHNQYVQIILVMFSISCRTS